MEKLHEERKVNHKKLKKGVDSLTNADAEKIIDQELVFEERELALKKEYHTKFKSVLPVKKVALLYQAEHEFRREILKKAREQHHNQQGGKPQGAPAGKPGMDDEE
jgi:predicted nucleic acid-binding protein